MVEWYQSSLTAGGRGWCHPKWHGVHFHKKYAQSGKNGELILDESHFHSCVRCKHYTGTRQTEEREWKRKLRTTGWRCKAKWLRRVQKARQRCFLKQKKRVGLNWNRERERESVTWLQTGEEVAQGAPATRKKPLTNTNTNEIWTRSTCIRRYWIVICVLVNEGGWMWKCEYKNGFWLPTPASIYTRPAMPETGMFLQMRIILLLANLRTIKRLQKRPNLT